MGSWFTGELSEVASFFKSVILHLSPQLISVLFLFPMISVLFGIVSYFRHVMGD